MSRRQQRQETSARRMVLVFLARCLAYWGAALALVSRVPAVDRAGVAVTLRTLQLVLGIVHQPVQRVGDALYVAGTSVQIVSECSPHMPYLIYAAVVLAFPAPWRRRLVGLVFGAVVIHVFNTVRILALIGILAWRREWFDFAHVYLWQTGTVLAVFATFALWLRSLSTRPSSLVKALLKLAAWATLMFALAWLVAQPYQKWIAGVAARTVTPPHSEIEWGDIEVFFPFDLSVYVALCLASSWVGWRARLGAIAIGLVALVVVEWLTLVVVMKALMVTAGHPEAEVEAIQRFSIAVIRLTGLVASGSAWLVLLGWQRMPELVRSFAPGPTSSPGGKR